MLCGAGKTGRLAKPRGAACGPSRHHPIALNSTCWGQPCLSACRRSAVSTDNQSAFADGPVACEQTGLVTTAILNQCCLKRAPTVRCDMTSDGATEVMLRPCHTCPGVGPGAVFFAACGEGGAGGHHTQAGFWKRENGHAAPGLYHVFAASPAHVYRACSRGAAVARAGSSRTVSACCRPIRRTKKGTIDGWRTCL